jgi:putative transposase
MVDTNALHKWLLGGGRRTLTFKVLRGDIQLRLREIIQQTCAEMGVSIEKGGLSCDHVHMFVSNPAHLALSTVMQRIKGRSSR